MQSRVPEVESISAGEVIQNSWDQQRPEAKLTSFVFERLNRPELGLIDLEI